jgi:hypothetical protein
VPDFGEPTVRAGNFAGAFIRAGAFAFEGDPARTAAFFFAGAALFFEAADRRLATFFRAGFLAAGFLLALPFAFDFTGFDLFILLRDLDLPGFADFRALRFEGFLAIRGSSRGIGGTKCVAVGPHPTGLLRKVQAAWKLGGVGWGGAVAVAAPVETAIRVCGNR